MSTTTKRRRTAPGPAPVLKMVPYIRSEDTIGCLQELLAEAVRGDLVGLAFAAQYRRRKYVVEATGEAHRNPTFAAGMVAVLGEALSRRAWGEPD